MVTVLVGLVGALVFGAADFLGGLSSRRMSALLTTAVSAAAGLLLLLVCALVIPGEWSPAAIGWGALSGVVGAVAISLLYACLAIGPMSILSPLTAVVSAIVPVTWAFVGGERLGPLAIVAIGAALVAVVLVGFVPEDGAVRPSASGLIMAIGSGVMIGAFYIVIDLTPEDSGVIPLVVNRSVNASIMFAAFAIVLLAARRGTRVPRVAGADGAGADGAGTGGAGTPAPGGALRIGLSLAVGCGVLDAVANSIILFGLRGGELSIMSVLIALYPAGTIILAAVVLRERIAPVQWIGLALAVASAGLLAVA